MKDFGEVKMGEDKEIIKVFSDVLERTKEVMYFVFGDPLTDLEKEKLRLQHTKAFYRMLGEFIRGRMNKVAFMDHMKTYLKQWEKITREERMIK